MDGGEGTVNDTPQSSDALSQPCAIYKSLKKFDSYLYVEKEGEFARVPAPLLQMLGRLEFVMTIELTPRRKLAKEAVVAAVAVAGVADHRVKHVFHVTPDLVLAARVRHHLEQRITRTRIWAHRVRQLGGGEPPISSDGRLRGLVRVGVRVDGGIQFLVERIVDERLRRCVATHHGEEGRRHLAQREVRGDAPRRLAVQREQQHARGGLVDAMDRIDAPPDLIAHALQRVFSLVAIDGAAVHQQARRFVDGDAVLVAIEDGEVDHTHTKQKEQTQTDKATRGGQADAANTAGVFTPHPV